MEINLIGKKIAILGFGNEGKSTLKFLRSQGIQDSDITILDKKYIEIQDFYGNIIFGDKYLIELNIYDYIFKSPGVSSYLPELFPYKNKILTQTKIFYELYKGKIISVTQTKGKSTTVTLIYNLLKNAGYNVKLVGNIGAPVLSEIDVKNDIYDFIIYELSSYMLEDLENHHSYISVLGNIYPDHLDWHLGYENYKKAKKNILKNASTIFIGALLYPELEKDLLKRNFFTFGLASGYISHLKNDFFINNIKINVNIFPKIPGDHNLNNFCVILGICDFLKIPYTFFETTINSFSGLPHRLENIGTYNEIICIDDAISTTPESTIEGIKSFGNQVDTIFLGGTDRGYSFEGLSKILEQYNIHNIVLFPESGEKIKKWLKIEKYNILETDNMVSAVHFALKYTQKGKICLLSTASPSYFLWKNFEAKGNEFKSEFIKQTQE